MTHARFEPPSRTFGKADQPAVGNVPKLRKYWGGGIAKPALPPALPAAAGALKSGSRALPHQIADGNKQLASPNTEINLNTLIIIVTVL